VGRPACPAGSGLGRQKYAGSWAESLWLRLDAVDFISQAMLLTATLLLCAVPFLLIATVLAGRSAASVLTAGPEPADAADVGHLFTSPTATFKRDERFSRSVMPRRSHHEAIGTVEANRGRAGHATMR
jgi:hypothetical protein